MLAGVGTLMSYRVASSTPAPTTNIDFLTINDVAGLPAGSTFTRASGATRTNASGVWEQVAADVLRVEHNAVGGRLGVLLEEASTNIVFPSAVLTTQSRAVTAVAHTLSFRGTGTVTLSGVATGATVGTGAANRVSLTFTPTAGSLTLTVTGSVTEAQLEIGTFPTSYIVTTAAAATRAREEFLLPPALGNSLVSGSHATCFILPRYGSAGKWPNSRSPYYCGDGTVGFMQWLTLATDVPQFSLRSGGVSQVLFNGPAPIPPDTPFAMCAAWGGGSSHASFAGTALIVDADALTPATVPTTFRVHGGLNTATVPGPNMILRYIRIWNGTKLTAQQVQAESGKTA